MMLALRRIVWSDGYSSPDDYNGIHAGQTVGRIYRMNRTGRELWRRTQSGIFQPTHGPNGGVADSLAVAKAAFRATVALDGAPSREPVSVRFGKSGRDMLNLSLSVDAPSLP
jgi:hypothetical protein